MKCRWISLAVLACTLAACDSSSGGAITDSSNSTANGSSVTWDSTSADSIISITSNTLTYRRVYWSGNTLRKSDNIYQYRINGDTLYFGYYGDTKYARVSGSAGSIVGKWRYISSSDDTAFTNTLTSAEKKRYDSLIQAGRNYAKIGGGIREIEFTNSVYHQREYFGKPAYMHMAYQLGSYYCANIQFGSYCISQIKQTQYKYIPAAVNDSTFTYNFTSANELVTLKYSTRRNEYFQSSTDIPCVYTSSNPNHTPIVMPASDYNAYMSSWLYALFAIE